MDFSLTEEQQAFRDIVRRWVDAEAPKDWMRALEADEENYPYALWDKIAEQGFDDFCICRDMRVLLDAVPDVEQENPAFLEHAASLPERCLLVGHKHDPEGADGDTAAHVTQGQFPGTRNPILRRGEILVPALRSVVKEVDVDGGTITLIAARMAEVAVYSDEN